ncbi:MAG: UDP-glucose/GDP-mannose dehydrogenase family protein [Candidatus Nanoarchaeia archaeon]|jgi:UDPglucose 6-dehydrogenase
MNLAIIGTGYVGLTSGICFASKGHIVKCIDIDSKKVGLINSKISPIYEEGMAELLAKVIDNGNLKATIDAKSAINESEVVFICVGTPSLKDGSINLDYIKQAAKTVADNLNSYKVIVVKSTVVPKTTEEVVGKILKESGKEFGLCMNPEFLKEGSAIKDFLEGDRIVLGVGDKKTESVMRKVYERFSQKIFVTTPRTAEMIKYANNSFLATKISFANELGNLCKKLGIDTYTVMDGIGMDDRINRKFLNSGAGFGGSCFPKDVKAIVSKGLAEAEPMILLRAVIKVNELQPLKMVELLKKHINIVGGKIGILGLAFKKGTDDLREAPSLIIIDELLRQKAKVIAYDPEAMNHAKKIFGERISYAKNSNEVINSSDAVLIVTEWDEFKNLDFGKKIVIDGRRMNPKSDSSEGICW